MRSRKERILFIHQFGGRGGASTMLANVIEGFRRTSYEPVVIAPPGDAVRQFEAAGASVVSPPKAIYQFAHSSGCHTLPFHPLFIKSLYRIRADRGFWCRYIREFKPALVHLNAVTLAPMALSLPRQEMKVVCFVQETAVRGLFGVRTKWLSHILRKRVDLAAFISDFDRRAFGCNGLNAEVIPNWVDLCHFDRKISKIESRRRLGLSSDARVVLFMGGVSEIKGTLVLLRAIQEMFDIDNLILILAGYNTPTDPAQLPLIHRGIRKARIKVGRDYHTRVASILGKEPLRSRVRAVGMIEDVVPLYAAADVVAFPAVRPHQARPVLEAGAMAKPVVVSNFPNLAEFVVSGVNGLMVPPGDSAALSEALRLVLCDSELARRLGEENYNVTKRCHDAVTNSARLVDIYGRLINGACRAGTSDPLATNQ